MAGALTRMLGRQAAAGAADPYFSNVVLLAGFESGLVDESSSPKTFTGNNTPTTPADGATHAKFGTKSVESNPTVNKYARVADSAAWAFGSGLWTVEFWVYMQSGGQTGVLLAQYDTNNQRSWRIELTSTDLQCRVSADGVNTSICTGAWVPTLTTWYHVAADYDGTALRCYAGGVMKGKLTAALNLFDSTAPLTIGHQLTSGAINGQVYAYFDEIRITKGVARYASDSGYTVPTAAFPRS